MKKHYFYTKIIAGIVISMALLPGASFAATNTQTTTAAQKVAAAQEQKMNNLKTRADQEVSRRVTSLTALVTKINSIKRLTDTQKADFTSEINGNIDNLNNLKIKIDADTDLDTLKTDVKSITDSYRIYLLFMPKINLLSAATAAQTASTQLNSLTTKIEQRIAVEDAAGKDTATIKTSLTNIKTKIASAQTGITDIQNTLISLTPEGYPGNKTTLTNARKSLKTVQQDLISARQDTKTLIQDLKALNSPSQTTAE